MLGNPTTMSTSSTSGAAPLSTNPNQNPNPDPFSNGPSVYLYGFLATLVLIFLVSIGVAWKGYRTRRLLRARIEEAIARGVLVPGYDPSNPNLPLFPRTSLGSGWRNAQVLVRPVLYEEWIGEKGNIEEGGEGRWDIKPTALNVLRPYDPTPLATPQHHHPSHANALLNQLLDPLRQYWFVQPPEGADADQLQGRPGRGRRGRDGRTDTLNRLEEEQIKTKKMEESMGLLGASEVVASVFIAMPDRSHPAWGVRSTGIASATANYHALYGGDGAGDGAGVASGSRPSSWQRQQQGIASGSRPTSSSAVAHPHLAAYAASHGASSSIGTAAVLEERKEELPELVLGIVQLGLREETKEEVEVEAEGEAAEGATGNGGVAGGGKEVEGNGGSEKGKKAAATSPL